MSILRDIVDTASSMKDGYDVFLKNNRRYSVAKEANRGILQFPALCSSTISLEDATMINKALEREYVSFVRVLTSMDSITSEKDVESYLKRIHQNFDQTSSRDLVAGVSDIIRESYDKPKFKVYSNEVIDSLNMVSESFFDDMFEDEECEEFSDIYQEVNCFKPIEEDCGIVNVASKSAIAEGKSVYKNPQIKGLVVERNGCISEMKIFKDNSGKYFQMECLPISEESAVLDAQIAKNCTRLLESINIKKLSEYDNGLRMDVLNDKTKTNNILVTGSVSKLNERNNAILGKRIVNLNESPSAEEFANGDIGDMADKKFNTVMDDNLTNNDVKKSNELVPTMLHLKTYFKNDLGELQAIDYLVGVKTTLHSIDSKSMIDNIVKGVKRNRTFFNFLKWTTGEIEFFKDFVLTIGDIKSDIKGKFSDSHWWNALRRRKKYASVLRKANVKNQLVPNTTLIVNLDEINILRNEYSIDLFDTRIVKNLVEEYFLLGVVIVDSSSEIAHFFFDGQSVYMKHSFASLERENSNQAKEVKNIMQILGKM